MTFLRYAVVLSSIAYLLPIVVSEIGRCANVQNGSFGAQLG